VENSLYLYLNRIFPLENNINPELTIIIPVYNESETILKVFDKIEENISVNHEVFVVYDNNDDTTIDVINRHYEKYNKINLVKNSVCPGPSGALRTGFTKANAPATLVTMADLSDELTGVDDLIKYLKNDIGVISFSRFCTGGNIILNKPKSLFTNKRLKHRLKVIFPRIAGWLINLFSGLGTVDPTNSFKLYSTSMLQKLDLSSTISFSVTLEIVMKTFALGYKIKEVPTTWTDRNFGVSNFPLTKSLFSYFPWLLIMLFRNRLYIFSEKWLLQRYTRRIKP
jgi:dolichol-phosphate mannosyltransferase